MPKTKSERQTPTVYVPTEMCDAHLTWRDEGRPLDSTTKCARLADHKMPHRSISGKEWADEKPKTSTKKKK